jgi:hypothetical protein
MNYRKLCPFALCMFAFFLLASCASKDQPIIPVTGAEEATVPALVKQAQENVLEYVISSSQLENIPSSADWQLDYQEPLKGEYHFLSGDWLMIVWLANAQEKNQQVVLSNKIEKVNWCGYVRPDGHVVDTSYNY